MAEKDQGGDKSGIHDAKPLPESKWAPDPGERPYKDAITKEHREALAEEGFQV